MRIAIIGAGAVGGYFGARLAEAGEDVAFVARGATLEALERDGLHLESPLGDLHLADVRATGDPASIGPVDAVIVGVKSWQVTEAARSIRPLLGDGTCVLPLQNGVEAPERLAAVLGAGPVLGGVCKILCRAVAPGRIRHLGAEPWIALGELDGRRSERVDRLRRALERARVKTEVPPDVSVALWEKFLFIVAVGGLGAVTRSPVGVLRSLPETRALLAEAMREVAAVAAARGVELGARAVDEALAFIDRLPAGAAASMQEDIVAGRPSELDDQNGAVARLGRDAGVDTPLNRFIHACLLPMERRARGSD